MMVSERGTRAVGNLESMNQIALDTSCRSGRSTRRSRYGPPYPTTPIMGMWEKMSNKQHEVNFAEPDRSEWKTRPPSRKVVALEIVHLR